MADQNLTEKIVSLCKRRGFIFPGSEIYGGLSGTWDYGPLGALLKKNLKDWWWEDMVLKRDDIVGLDAAIMMNPRVWEASGHVEGFADNRSYKINSDKIARVLGFTPQFTVEDAIRDMCVMFKEGYWRDALTNANYTNVKQYVEIYGMGAKK